MSKANRDIKQSLEVLRFEAQQRGDRKSELLACLGLTNLVMAEIQAEVAHNLKALYSRLPLESSSPTDWVTPIEELRRKA